MYNLGNIQASPSYSILVSYGFSDLDVVAYYGTPIPHRKVMIDQIKNGGKIEVVKPITVKNVKIEMVGTQMCTKNSLLPMFTEHMNKDFEYRGVVYNMVKMGWTFNWIATKNAFGRCHRRIRRNNFTGQREIMRKQIQISTWLIDNSKATYADWVDTILHEIAHAIDVEIRGKSDHSERWKAIARAIGCNAERTTDVEVDAKNSKYTLTCPNCNSTQASHKILKRKTACSNCCDEHNGGRYSDKFAYIQTQNY